MDYLITNDKRKTTNNVLFLISCLLYAIVEIFILSKIKISNETLNTIYIILQCVLGLSPLGFYYLGKFIFNRLLMLICGIKNLSGKYSGKLISVQGKTKLEINAIIIVKHTYEKIFIDFSTNSSSSTAKNIHVDFNDNFVTVIYNYENQGNPTDVKNKSHIGTCELRFVGNKIDGFYFNNGRDRNTFGSIKLEKND